MLGACAVSTRSADAVRETARLDARLVDETPPAELLRACAGPVRLKGKALDAGAVERLWRTDRAALVDCGGRKGAVQDFYQVRDAGLASDLKSAQRDSGNGP